MDGVGFTSKLSSATKWALFASSSSNSGPIEGANAAKAGAREDATAEGYEREGAKAAKAGAREDATAAEEDSC